MANPPIDIDRIVREVISQLGLGPEAQPSRTAPSETGGEDIGVAGAKRSGAPESQDLGLRCAQPPATPNAGIRIGAESETGTADAGNELVVNCRVVTLSEVGGRLETVRRLVVPPQAVITPAVRDELQRRNIALAFASPPPVRADGQLRLVMVTAGSRFDPTRLAMALDKEAIRLERHTSDCLMAATDLLAGEVARGDTLGLLLARQTAAGLCLANRHRGVRAVSAADAPAVSAAAVAVGANVLVIDPTAGGIFQLKQMVTEFCRGGVRQCPEVFQQRLA